jgi:hypothetical protein
MSPRTGVEGEGSRTFRSVQPGAMCSTATPSSWDVFKLGGMDGEGSEGEGYIALEEGPAIPCIVQAVRGLDEGAGMQRPSFIVWLMACVEI